MERRGLAKSPESPTPAVIPVKAGNTMAKTKKNESGFSKPLKRLTDPMAAPSTGDPRKKNRSERTRMPTTTQRARTPRLAPRVTTNTANPITAGRETIRGSHPKPVAFWNHCPSGEKASAKAIM